MPDGPTVVVIDDDRSVLLLVERTLTDDDYRTITADSAEAGLQTIREHQPAAVFLDIMLPETSGLELFSSIREVDAKLPVVFITAAADSDTAIDAMRLGAFDYISKPLDVAHLRAVAARAIKTRQLMSVPVALGAEPLTSATGEELAFIGRSPAMLEVFKSIGRVAEQDVPVLIRGESGTGKETRGSRHLPAQSTCRSDLPRSQLCRLARLAPGERTVRVRKGGLHRGGSAADWEV